MVIHRQDSVSREKLFKPCFDYCGCFPGLLPGDFNPRLKFSNRRGGYENSAGVLCF